MAAAGAPGPNGTNRLVYRPGGEACLGAVGSTGSSSPGDARLVADAGAPASILARVDALAFEHHLTSPQGHHRLPWDGFTVAAGGGGCCDTVQISISVDRDRVADGGLRGDGCGAATAAGSAAVTLVRGQTVLDVARVGPREIAAELGGLSPGKLHAAEVAGDALARALGAAVRAAGSSHPPAGGRTWWR